jgi:ferritin-like metal-binding protein YciE
MPSTLEEQLTKYLTDVHSIEEQALQQLRTAPKIAGDPELARAFGEHLTETEDQERRVRERLEARGANPSKTKDLVARAGGIGMLLFARSQPDTPGKLTAHAFSYEHMEIAAYDLLALIADRAGDRDTAHAARSIREQESDMAGRLAAGFDRAVEASPSGELPDTSRTRMRSRGRRSSCSRRGRESPASPISPAFLRRRLRAAQASRRAGGRPGDRARGERIAREERAAAAAIRRQFDAAMEATLEAQGVA